MDALAETSATSSPRYSTGRVTSPPLAPGQELTRQSPSPRPTRGLGHGELGDRSSRQLDGGGAPDRPAPRVCRRSSGTDRGAVVVERERRTTPRPPLIVVRAPAVTFAAPIRRSARPAGRARARPGVGPRRRSIDASLLGQQVVDRDVRVVDQLRRRRTGLSPVISPMSRDRHPSARSIAIRCNRGGNRSRPRETSSSTPPGSRRIARIHRQPRAVSANPRSAGHVFPGLALEPPGLPLRDAEQPALPVVSRSGWPA